MNVEIWSDVMCPFCFVGKRNFEAALRQLPFQDQIKVTWKSFQLDPTLPVDGATMSAAEYLSQKKGFPKEKVAAMQAQLVQSGLAAGIDFHFERSIPANTFRAHRLIHFAQEQGKGNEMEEALFEAHFTEGKNVGDIETLADLAAGIGLDKQSALTYLQTDSGSEAVHRDIQEARELGVNGVPFFVLDRKYAVSGAQPVAAFVAALTQTFEQSQPKIESEGDTDAGACGPDGCVL